EERDAQSPGHVLERALDHADVLARPLPELLERRRAFDARTRGAGRGRDEESRGEQDHDDERSPTHAAESSRLCAGSVAVDEAEGAETAPTPSTRNGRNDD